MRVALEFLQDLFWSLFGLGLNCGLVRVCFGVALGFVLRFARGLLRVGVGFIQAWFTVDLGFAWGIFRLILGLVGVGLGLI